MGNYWFITYYLNYKNTLVDNPSRTFSCTTNCFYFLSNFNNLSEASSLLAGNNGACIALLGLVTKKEESSRTLIYLFSHFLQSLSLLLSLTLASFPLLADYPLIKLTNKVFFDFSYVAQTVKFSLNNYNIQLVIFTDLSFTANNNLLLQIGYIICLPI